jgi:transcriptional regulator with XRE-family HTH domain
MAKQRKDGSRIGTPRDWDVRVGARVKSRRIQLGMSQTELADVAGVTFQQVQKYERGVNRIGSGRLFQIARSLAVTPGYFFDDLMQAGANCGAVLATEILTDFIASRDGVALMRAFMKIKSQGVRQKIVELVADLEE